MDGWKKGLSTYYVDSISEIQLPEILYKYRDWENKYHQSVITKSLLYFSSPRDFEDPKDCKNLVDFSLYTPQEILNLYLDESKKNNPKESDEFHMKYAEEWFNQGLLQDKARIKSINIKYEENFFDRFGVLSLTENFKSPQMWKKYANNRSGFCIGYDTKCLVSGYPNIGGGNVEYVQELPRIHPSDQGIKSHVVQIITKEKKWTFEEEYRLFINGPNKLETNQRLLKIPDECVKEIIFGAEMTEKNKKEIRQIAKKRFPNVVFKKMKKIP